MSSILPYLLVPIMAILLVSAQAFWASGVKFDHLLVGSPLQIVANLLTSWKMWAGAAIYIIATLVYFFLLSKLRFFSVQITMTALSIVFSMFLSFFLFSEKPSMLNIVGVSVVFIGILLVMHE